MQRRRAATLCGVGARTRVIADDALARACEAARDGHPPADGALRARLIASGVLVAKTPRAMTPTQRQAWAMRGISPRQAARTLKAVGGLRTLGTAPNTETAQARWWKALTQALERYGLTVEAGGDAGGWLARWEEGWAQIERGDAQAFVAVRDGEDGLVVAARSAAGAGQHGACLGCVGAAMAASTRGGHARAAGGDGEGRCEHAPEAAAAHAAETLARGQGTQLRWWPAHTRGVVHEETVAAPARCTCGAAAGTVSAAERLEAAIRGMGPWTGVCESAEEQVNTGLCDHAFAFVWTTTQSARSRTMRLIGTRGGGRSRAAGKGSARGAARDGAMAETIERKAVTWRAGLDEEVASAESLERAGRRYLSPKTLQAFSATQMRERDAFNARGYLFAKIPAPFDARARAQALRWSRGVDLLAGKGEAREVLLPSSWTHMGAPAESPLAGSGERGDMHYCAADTNGVAAGPNPHRAFARAVAELLERDAVGMWWLTRVRRPAMACEEARDPLVAGAKARFEMIGRALEVLDLTAHPQWPVACAVSWWREPVLGCYHDVVVSAGCARSREEAARRAISENAQVGPTTRHTSRSWYSPFQTGEASATARLTPEQAPWLRGTSPTRALGVRAKPEDDETLAARALGALRDLDAGCVVVEHPCGQHPLVVRRVAAPGLCHFWHRLGAPRLAQAPVALGWCEAPPREDDMNPLPLML